VSAITSGKTRISSIGNMDSYVILAFIIYGFFSQYLFLSITGGISLVIILRSLWKPFVPPVLLFFMSFHWLQVFASIVHADVAGLSLDELHNSHNTDLLLFMTFLHVTTMTLVLNYFIENKNNQITTLQSLQEAAKKLNTKNVIIGYFIALFIVPVIISFSHGSPALYQLALSFRIIKVAFLALLFFILLLKDTKNKVLLVSIIVFDFVLSFASFFSDFKTTLIMMMIVYFTVHPHLKKGTFIKMLPVGLALFLFFSFWSAVKGNYRLYLNQGTAQQVKAVSNEDALAYIFGKAAEADLSTIREGAEIFLSRVQYMERYSEVYKTVPEIIPFQNGGDLIKTINFLLVPRFLNPDKGVKDASERTSYYTGKRFTRASQGTSISMGYFCDMYIDFGLYLMFVPLIFIAALVGLVYKKIVAIKSYNRLFLNSILIGTFLSLGTFESDSLFFLGMLRNNIVLLLLAHFTLFPFINKFIQEK